MASRIPALQPRSPKAAAAKRICFGASRHRFMLGMAALAGIIACKHPTAATGMRIDRVIVDENDDEIYLNGDFGSVKDPFTIEIDGHHLLSPVKVSATTVAAHLPRSGDGSFGIVRISTGSGHSNSVVLRAFDGQLTSTWNHDGTLMTATVTARVRVHLEGIQAAEPVDAFATQDASVSWNDQGSNSCGSRTKVSSAVVPWRFDPSFTGDGFNFRLIFKRLDATTWTALPMGNVRVVSGVRVTDTCRNFIDNVTFSAPLVGSESALVFFGSAFRFPNGTHTIQGSAPWEVQWTAFIEQ